MLWKSAFPPLFSNLPAVPTDSYKSFKSILFSHAAKFVPNWVKLPSVLNNLLSLERKKKFLKISVEASTFVSDSKLWISYFKILSDINLPVPVLPL